MKKLIITLSLSLGFLTTTTYAQGCSDAGFCTMNSFKPNENQNEKTNNNQIKMGIFTGMADHEISVFGNYIEYNRALNEKFGLDVKITTLAQSGNSISTFGLSDLFVNANYAINPNLKATLGTKIPLSNGNKFKNNLPLPMDYQSSLGTFDLVFGLGYQIKKWQIATAVQIPLTQNENQFFASFYFDNPSINVFQSTNQFKRSADALIRISYPFEINNKLKLTPSLLPIYHLANDKFTNQLNIQEEITGSRGLTLNGNIYLDYELNSTSSLQLNIATPFIIRDARPDGLTRSFIANLEYKYKF